MTFLRNFFQLFIGCAPVPSPPGKATICQPADQPFIRMAVMAARADNQDPIA